MTSPSRISTIATLGLVLRELVGWVLVALGIYVFRLSIVDYFNRALTIEGIITVTMGVFLFRGGLHLVKVCIAARAAHVPAGGKWAEEVPGQQPSVG